MSFLNFDFDLPGHNKINQDADGNNYEVSQVLSYVDVLNHLNKSEELESNLKKDCNDLCSPILSLLWTQLSKSYLAHSQDEENSKEQYEF